MTVPFDPEALVDEVAFAVFVGSGEDETAETFAALDDYTLQAFRDAARTAIRTFTEAATRLGIRFVPEGTIMVPKTEEEAALMIGVAKRFMDAQKRKPKLLGTPGLVIPGRGH